MDNLPLPTFEGDIASWRSFWQRLTSSVRGDFADNENWSAIKDVTAKEIVQESIEMVTTMILFSFRLLRRMDRHREVFLGALLSTGHWDYDRKGLSGLVSEV